MTNADLPADPFEDDIDTQVAAFAAQMSESTGASPEQLEELAAQLYATDNATETPWHEVALTVARTYSNLAIAVERAGWAPVSL
jgi:hypothetical protein